MVYSDHLRLLNPALPERQPLYQYGYAIDPDPVMSCPRLKPAARLVYRGILRLCGRGTVCRASVEQIASQAGVSVRSVQRHVSLLTDRDLIETEEEPGSPTIFRLLPLPAWLVEGRRAVLAEERGPGTPDRRPTIPSSPAGAYRGTVVGRRSSVSPPQGRQPDGGGVTGCQGRGDKLSPPMEIMKHELENPISLSGSGSDSGTRWTDQPPAPERERVGENLQPVQGETPGPQPPDRRPVTADRRPTIPSSPAGAYRGTVVGHPLTCVPAVPAPPTPQQIVRQTWETLGLHPTRAQVSLGLRDVADLCADGFSLWEIGEGARYAAEQGWVRSFAGVKFYLPQALNRLSLKKAQSAECRAQSDEPHTPCAMRRALCDSPVSWQEAAEASPHRDLWEQVRGKIATRIQRQSYQTWFEPTYIGDFDGQRVVLEVSSHFFQEWLEEHYLDLIEETFEEVLGHAVEVAFEIPKGGG